MLGSTLRETFSTQSDGSFKIVTHAVRENTAT